MGDISDAFIVPRYVQFFYDTFGEGSQQDFCEIGSGNGDLARAILAANRGAIKRYVTSEAFPEGVDWLRNQGLEAVYANAESLPWGDAELDAAVEFDVMHHVDNPAAMACEMMRVGRGRCLLVESNGLSVFRKVKELSPSYRAAGERSYAPWTWRSFFERHVGYRVLSFRVAPFLFAFRCPSRLLPALVRFNQIIEHIPLLRWQCASVMISVSYQRTGETS